MKAKKLGHKYYGIKRKNLFINLIKNNIYNIDLNYDRYRIKLEALAKNGDINQLSNQLFLKPNTVLSMMVLKGESTSKYVPLLWLIAIMGMSSKKDCKMFELFVDCLLHFVNELLLQQPHPDDEDTQQDTDSKDDADWESPPGAKLFLTRYFSFEADGGEQMYTNDKFWGIPVEDNVSKKVYSLMDRIMGSKFNICGIRRDVISTMLGRSPVEYLSLIIKYHEKHKHCIKNFFNALNRLNQIEALLIGSANNRGERLKAVFKLCEVGVKHYGLKVEEKIFLQLFEKVFKNEKYKSVHQYQPIVQEYYEKFFPHSVDKDDDNQ